MARLQELEGSEEHRIGLLAAGSDLHPRLIRMAHPATASAVADALRDHLPHRVRQD